MLSFITRNSIFAFDSYVAILKCANDCICGSDDYRIMFVVYTLHIKTMQVGVSTTELLVVALHS